MRLKCAPHSVAPCLSPRVWVLVLIISQRPLATLSFCPAQWQRNRWSQSLQGTFAVRIWGAPATLATFALMGTLIGLAKSRQFVAGAIILETV